MSEKKPYHREDLRNDLLNVGREYVKQNGHINLSIRTLAQQVGVSPGAPYYHFPDRRSFLLALAKEGFRDMLAGTTIVVASKMAPEEKLRRMGVLFIKFADDNPNLIDLMYESELTMPTLDPGLLEFQLMGHDALRSQIVAALPGIADAEADVRSVAFWSGIYGFATMRRKGVIRPHDPRTLPSIDIAEALVDRCLLSALSDGLPTSTHS
ncbi:MULTISPECIES: TetR/AcrR family transcriptional regulator [unclassified Sphingomonas]|uniref:TetR/AcrR family transcriptional regulator n=1 Tax=Novosphingobium rhizosphaerae TaxID=1551649 RepID=UPI0015C6A087